MLRAAAHRQNRDGTGEPFEWFEGISIWPTQLLRVIVIFLGFTVIWLAVHSIRATKSELVSSFGVRHGFWRTPGSAS